MPHEGIRFAERSRARNSKKGQLIAREESRPVATSVKINPDVKIEQIEKVIEGVPDEKTFDLPKQDNVKKEEPTPENNDVKTESKE